MTKGEAWSRRENVREREDLMSVLVSEEMEKRSPAFTWRERE